MAPSHQLALELPVLGAQPFPHRSPHQKIYTSNGDELFFLSPSDAIVEEVAYPMDAVADGETYGRLPNGIGSFEACDPTPGAVNTKAP